MVVFSMALILQAQEDLKYEVSVRAQIVPVFAVDAEGNPVYDLKEDEIELYVNGKPSKLAAFISYTLEETQRFTIEKKEKLNIKPKTPERLIFIIIDSILGNKSTLDKSRDIAKGLIDKSSPGDAFVIIESNNVSGFYHVAGPSKDKKELNKALDNIIERFKRRRLIPPPAPKPDAYADLKKWAMDMEIHGNEIADVTREQDKYKRDILTFSHALKQLKHALKTTTLPKSVFLFSSGLSQKGLGGSQVTYCAFLEDAAKAINYGGAMFYLVNPETHRSRSDATSLKFMADTVGGEFIAGDTTPKMVQKIKKSTSAYYEVAFYPDNKQRNKVTLKCKRDDVRLTTINFSEQGVPYREMGKTQKKLFALNVITGGSWSRMVGKVTQTRYKKIKSKSPAKNIVMKIPTELRNRENDIFVLNVDPKTLRAAIGIQTKTLGEKETVTVPVMEGKKQFVVVVEPTNTHCIFTPVN
jgi:VWFA-related protein